MESERMFDLLKSTMPCNTICSFVGASTGRFHEEQPLVAQSITPIIDTTTVRMTCLYSLPMRSTKGAIAVDRLFLAKQLDMLCRVCFGVQY
jgi:hypothetical protein